MIQQSMNYACRKENLFAIRITEQKEILKIMRRENCATNVSQNMEEARVISKNEQHSPLISIDAVC